MTARPLVLLGGGGHARVVADAARSVPGAWELLGIVDPGPAQRTRTLLGLAHLGDDEAFAARLLALEPDERPWLVVALGAIGDPSARRSLAARFAGASWAPVIHAAAWVSPEAIVGPGAVVLGGAIVNAGATLGEHAIVNSGAVVEHDAAVGAFAQLAPGAVIGGGAVVGEDAFVGLGARVRDHVTVGAGAMVAMGSVVVGDVAPGTSVAGVPARAFGAPAGVGS